MSVCWQNNAVRLVQYQNTGFDESFKAVIIEDYANQPYYNFRVLTTAMVALLGDEKQ